ncbi:adenine glycosylase [Pseudoalteromonas obscura]|uniref:Adenine glycosylase n=1 Tax=Pseudoalteromonas obscura TaxID=3048491 RepID=A0ABT7ES75_9GAMM|nr:adenine glycosylase [Pseudoalteromonas sp. P94(2023)]MDK2597893.1 adenine glycosylase [Pseudoalteromonas sp. P94(2023)]
MSLSLNSTEITLKSLRITASQMLASEDVSGLTSNTDEAETGIKAKRLTVSGLLHFEQSAALSELFSLAEAADNGARVIYRISNPTASALGIKQVRFSGKIEAVEQESTRQWAVSFGLAEYRSVPQKIEERQAKTDPQEQSGHDIKYGNIQAHLTAHLSQFREGEHDG